MLYIDRAADRARALALVERSLDRLGVCNRLNLLLVAEDALGRLARDLPRLLERLGIRPSLPPHDHPLGPRVGARRRRRGHGHAGAGDGAARRGPRSRTTRPPGLAAAIVTEDPAAAEEFLAAYGGTGAFWNATTRLLDGFSLLGAPETGINVDHVPGPRGPVTFRDLHLRQYVVVPTD